MARAKTILLLALAAGFCLAGCSKKDVPSEGKRLTIAVIPKGTIHEFWKTVHAGTEMAGQELNVEILWKGSLQEDDREAQIGVVEVFAAALGLKHGDRGAAPDVAWALRKKIEELSKANLKPNSDDTNIFDSRAV